MIVMLLVSALSHIRFDVFTIVSAEMVNDYNSVADPVLKAIMLNSRPEPLGFHFGVWDGWLLGSAHIQGIARYNNVDGTAYLFVTTSNTFHLDNQGHLLIVEMASRNSAGERLGSNRVNTCMQCNKTTKDIPPPPEDKVVSIHLFDWKHAGGMQIIDNYLIVAVEDGIRANEGKLGSFEIFDISDPTNPVKIYQHPEFPCKTGVAGITKDDDGHYIVIIGTSDIPNEGDSNKILFFLKSESPNNLTDFTFLNSWVAEGDFDTQGSALGTTYQTLNLIRDTRTEYLYLFGMVSTSALPEGGDDYLDVFRVMNIDGEYVVDGQNRLVHKHMWCKTPDGAKLGDFIASGGVYISSSGELILYSTPHYGDTANGIEFIPVAEFRHIDVVSDPNSSARKPKAVLNDTYVLTEGDTVTFDGSESRPQFDKGWVQFFENANFQGKMVLLDWVDYQNVGLINLDLIDGFGADADSMNYYVPPNCRIYLWHKSDGNKFHILEGAYSAADLDDHVWLINDIYGNPIPTTDPMGDDIKFVIFSGDGTQNFTGIEWNFGGSWSSNRSLIQEWTYPDNGVFNVSLRVTQDDGDNDTCTAKVFVINAEPIVNAGNDRIAKQGNVVSFSGAFTDKGILDTHNITWDFGDGDSMDGTLLANHTYTEIGSYIVKLTVTDDDGGVGFDTLEVKVIEAAAKETGGVDWPITLAIALAISSTLIVAIITIRRRKKRKL